MTCGGVSAGQLRISSAELGGWITLRIEDDGPGLPDKARAGLFQPFMGSTRRGGTGLGLAIAAELVRAHGGELNLVDGTIGATFRIMIPDRAVELHRLRDTRVRA